jgi:hypothetical protein
MAARKDDVVQLGRPASLIAAVIAVLVGAACSADAPVRHKEPFGAPPIAGEWQTPTGPARAILGT